MRILSSTKLYDLFKFSVALILLIALFLLMVQRSAPLPSQPLTQISMPTKVPLISMETPEPVPTQEQELSPFPDSPETLTYNPESHALETSEGFLIYQLNEESGDWVPIIPNELASALGSDFELRSGRDNWVEYWVIVTKDGNPTYFWDLDTLSWKEVVSETAETEDADAGHVPEMNIDCPLAKPSRLVAGSKGVVTSPLNIRSSPGIAKNRLFTMSPGTELYILGNPTCLPHHKGAYLWWQVEIPGVQIGWSAEAPQNEEFYFIDPIQ